MKIKMMQYLEKETGERIVFLDEENFTAISYDELYKLLTDLKMRAENKNTWIHEVKCNGNVLYDIISVTED